MRRLRKLGKVSNVFEHSSKFFTFCGKYTALSQYRDALGCVPPLPALHQQSREWPLNPWEGSHNPRSTLLPLHAQVLTSSRQSSQTSIHAAPQFKQVDKHLLLFKSQSRLRSSHGETMHPEDDPCFHRFESYWELESVKQGKPKAEQATETHSTYISATSFLGCSAEMRICSFSKRKRDLSKHASFMIHKFWHLATTKHVSNISECNPHSKSDQLRLPSCDFPWLSCMHDLLPKLPSVQSCSKQCRSCMQASSNYITQTSYRGARRTPPSTMWTSTV